MATATKKIRANGKVSRGATVVTGSSAMTFLVFEDNGGSYYWTIHDGGGESLAQSGRYDSRDDAANAAHAIHEGIGSAQFEPDVASEPPIDLKGRREAATA